MRARLTVWVCLSLLVCLIAGAQERRLGDVAGSVKLDPSALTEGGPDIEDPAMTKKADKELLEDVLSDCLGEAERFGSLIVEARGTIMYRDAERVLPIRLENASYDLEAAAQEIYRLRLTPPFEPALDVAREAAGPCEQAAVSLRDELERLGVAFTQALELNGECKRELTAVLEIVEASGPGTVTMPASDETAGSGGAADTDGGPTPDEVIAAFCERVRPKGQAVYDACVAGQYRGLAAVESRSAASEQVDEVMFEGVRRICADQYRRDFVRRDQCEQERLTALRIELDAQP